MITSKLDKALKFDTWIPDRQSWSTMECHAGGKRSLAVSCSTGQAWDDDEGTERHQLFNNHYRVHNSTSRHKTCLIVLT